MFICPAATIPVGVPGQDFTDPSGEYFMSWGLTSAGAPAQRKTYFSYVLNSKLNTVKLPKMSGLRPAANVVLIVEKRVRRPWLRSRAFEPVRLEEI